MNDTTSDPMRTTKHRMLTGILFLIAFVSGCNGKETPPPIVSDPGIYSGDEKLVSSVIASEDLILDLSSNLKTIANYLQDETGTPNPFSNMDRIVGLKSGSIGQAFHTDETKPEFVQVAKLEVSELSKGTNNPWEPLNELGVRWVTTRFGVLSAEFLDEKRTRFQLDTKVEARGTDEQTMFGLKGHQQLVFTWRKSQWQLSQWVQEDLKLIKSGQPLFKEVLAETINDANTLSGATRSYKDEMLLKWAQLGQLPVPRMDVRSWVGMTSNHIFPSVSVVDYNNDGFDDLFLTARWGPTQMLKNNGDGTFEEVTKAIGLDQPYMVNCVLFADLDNDGDKDAIMGRPMEKSLYLRNDNGKYKDVTDTHSDLGEQYFISSITATDVNRDGLLDVYLTSYVPLKAMDFDSRFLSARERSLFRKNMARTDVWVNKAGASNVLLMNRGDGKMERVPYDDLISQWRRSFQGTWADIDSDGDDDLYVCTDFAPNSLLRNDTPKGASEPVFSKADDLFVDGLQGFSMGGSWGDYDSDGDLDLYVSNMFSKAGRRIIGQVETKDPRLIASAAGNFLFENQDGKFKQMAGDNALAVDKVGWSWGGQWSDFDNDGDLDLYVPSGYYTAPKEISGVDL